MTQYNARLLNAPALRKIVELTDDLSQHGQEIADALADYESAEELPPTERTEAREDARDVFVEAMGELLAVSNQIRLEYERVNDTL